MGRQNKIIYGFAPAFHRKIIIKEMDVGMMENESGRAKSASWVCDRWETEEGF